MNRSVKKIAQLLLPKRVFATIQSVRSRNYQKRLHQEWGVSQATQEAAARYGFRVLAGPFSGMSYPHSSLLIRDGIPILFATYELELQPVIDEVASKQYAGIVDIGCAEGYYAVGLARRTRTTVYAFDCEPRERSYCRQMALENGVADLVRVRSWCSSQRLERLVRGRWLVISDCEGYEADLFTPEVVAALGASDAIIELHDVPGMDVRRVILDRFQRSHDLRIITFDAGNIGSTVPGAWLGFAREIRAPGQQWVYLTPRRQPAGDPDT